MTPKEYITQLKELVALGHDREALDLSARFWPEIAPRLTGEELVLVSGLMEGAETAVEIQETAGARQEARAP